MKTEKARRRGWCKNTLDTILERINIDDMEECWEWTGYITQRGYGEVNFEKGRWALHRLVFYHVYEKYPYDIVMHLCDNRKCCNPLHLKHGTPGDNVRDMVSKNRQAKGSKQSQAVLNETKVLIIKLLLKEGYRGRDIAKFFNVAETTISAILKGVNWAHVTT